MAIIALVTDFGTRDHYVAAIKGVILQINPKATLIDITHDIAPGDISHGAFILRQVVPYYPPKTIFVAVVDPTVGTKRRILAARYNDRLVIAPDNGLLTFLHRDAQLQELCIVQNHQFFAGVLSNTFHGRDIMAPVAAHLSRGVALAQLGPSAEHIDILNLPRAQFNPDGTLDGQVILADRFGNLITNISAVDLSAARTPRHRFEVSAGAHLIGPIHTTYADVPQGHLVALVGSTQMLEIAINGGNAAETLGLSRGAAVRLG